jgi:hypothetical protein
MAITNKFTFSWPKGIKPVTHAKWVNSLSPSDRAQYDAANARQNAITDAAIAAGKLTVNNRSMTWVNPEDYYYYRNNKDPIWVTFWNRFTNETNVVVNKTTE